MNILNFPIQVYGKLERYNDTISKGRCRIFYKYGNQNGAYITDQFADELLKSLPYAPVKGIFDDDAEDFTDHGTARTEGRVYGVVPSELNFAWEDHQDDDGITRKYACADVLLFTGLYPAASLIPGKSLSMELYRPSIKGAWQTIEGKRYYVYEAGSFLGLQALGDDVEPCFEGAEFYTLYNSLQTLVDKLEATCENFAKNQQGGSTMAFIDYKLSDEQKRRAIFNALNPNFNEEGNWTIDWDICDVYDNYAIIYNISLNQFERAYYTKNDETDELTIDSRVPCYIIDVTEEEKEILNNLTNQYGTYTAIQTAMTNVDNLNQKISENDANFVELNNKITTLTTERDNAVAQEAQLTEALQNCQASLNEAKQTLAGVQAANEQLTAYKKNVQDNAKKNIIDSYSANLPSEVLENYLNNLDAFSLEDLDKELTYEVKKARPEIFNLKSVPAPAYVPKDVEVTGNSLSDILSHYENK